MGRGVTHARGGSVSDHHSGRPLYNAIGRSNTNAIITDHRGGHLADQDSWNPWADNWAAHMWNRRHARRYHRASVHIR